MRAKASVSMVVIGSVFCCLIVGGWNLDAQSSSGQSAGSAVEPGLGGEFEGMIQAARVISLSSPADGLIESVMVERGDVVEKGQIVATLESTVETATWELAQARANSRSRLNFLTAKLERGEELHSQGIVSFDELDLLRTERLIAEEAQQVARLEQKRAEAVLALRTLRSPFDGVVIDRVLSPGELVTRQHQSKILILAQIDPLVVEVIVPGRIFGKIAVGTEAQVLPAGFSEYRATAVVKTVDRVIDARSHTFRVSLEMPNPDNRLPAGVKCGVQFQPGE